MTPTKTLKHILLAISLTLATQGFAQDLHFSQFFEAPLLRNPSLAGIYTGDIRVQAVYRDQWNSITQAYKTVSANAEYKMPIGKANDFITAGIQMLYDQAGSVSWKTTHILPAINYHKSLSSEHTRYLSVGFMAGPVQQRLDRSKITTNSTYDTGADGETISGPQYTYFDAAAGISFNTQMGENPDNNMFLGVGYHHFNRPKQSFYRDASQELSPKMVASAGLKFSVTEASYFTLQGDYSTQGNFRELIAGAMYGIKLGDDLENPKYTLHAGAFMRVNDAFIPVIKLDYNPFSISLSYDANLSQLKSSSKGRGGFELGLSYVAFNKKKERRESELFPLPEILKRK